MSSHYDDDSDLDIRVRHRGPPPQPIRYVHSPPRARSYYGVPGGPSYLVPEHTTTVVARSRSRDRSRDRRSPPPPVPAQPVIINNRIYNELSEDDDSSDDDRRSHRKRGSHRRRRSAHRSRSRSSSRSRSRSNPRLKREDWEAEQARRELEQLRLVRDREKDDRRLVKEYRDEAELRRAKRELDDIKRREEKEEEAGKIKREIELKRLKEEEEAAEVKRQRDKHAQEAVEKYKKEELERQAKEKKQREEYEKEYKRRMQEDLLKSGLDEKAIAAIMNKQKIPTTVAVREHVVEMAPAKRPTYTRMARKYLSIETLRELRIEYDMDPDPEFVLIKRWVPEWEQDQFWRHTKHVREKRGKLLMVEEKKHHHKGAEFEWVRKKHDRKRSKSPALLMYLAGAKPN
ncbi:hypothetical protein PT974_11851 [Cladobotryum mycophilum]|uniref:DUF8035 domain-containing protein n=1 Tax=Cladobotryum mycophilum TaxID=491253 RepID=A0ABR0S6E0_9HYPO